MGQPGQPVPSPQLSRSRQPAEIFRVGTYDGVPYTREFLQQVVDNYNQFQAKQDPRFPRPPAYYADANFAKKLAAPPLSAGRPDIGIGHEGDQAYLRWLLGRKDLPSAGWPTNLRLDGDTLYADFEDMPPEVASLVNGGQLPHCSAEFYPNYTDESGKQYGPALRRVALLGGEVPKVKGLAPNPTMVFSEPSGQRSIVYFSEIHMDRQKLLDGLRAAGIDCSGVTDAMPDAFLASILTAITTAKSNAVPTTSGTTTLPAAPVNGFAEEKNPDGTPKTPAQPKVVNAETPKTDPPNAAVATNAEQCMKKFADSLGGGMTDDQKNNAANTFAEAIRIGIAGAVNPLLQQMGLMSQRLVSLETVNTQGRVQKERQEIAAFCEQMSREGRVTPYELADKDEKGLPKQTLVDIIMAFDDSQAVIAFGEAKVTQRGSFMKTIALRPGQMVGRREQMAQPGLNSSVQGNGTGATVDTPMAVDDRVKALSHTQTGRGILAREIKDGKLDRKYLPFTQPK